MKDLIRKRIDALRALMKEVGLSAYMIPTTDYHGSEYVNPHFRFREYMSGFTGSAGTLVVTESQALLWTDGRYFLQAKEQLAGTGIQLMKMGVDGVPTIKEWIASRGGESRGADADVDGGESRGADAACRNLSKNVESPGAVLGFDGRVVSTEEALELSKIVTIRGDLDFSAQLWQEDIADQWGDACSDGSDGSLGIAQTPRQKLIASEPYPLPLEVTGETAESKLARIRQQMSELGADYHLVASLEEIAWMNNLRGNDIPCNPVFYAYQLVGMEDSQLFCLWDGSYDHVGDALDKLGGKKILLDPKIVNFSLYNRLPKDAAVIFGRDPAQLMMAIKNPVEIQATKNAHIKDGVAMVNFLYWLKANVGVQPISEVSAGDYLELCRAKQDGFKDLSFDTICGYGPHGAIIHYAANFDSNVRLESQGFLLVDSGGQYSDGTTDITRTVALGPLSKEMKDHYTAVLKAHIKLAMAKFNSGTTGAELDELCRNVLRERGLDYAHGTGHGVGHMLSVHEGPQNISPRGKEQEMLPGMITSDEPGVYLEGQYGIRLENELLCVEAEPASAGLGAEASAGLGSAGSAGLGSAGSAGLGSAGSAGLAFEVLTLCPFDKDAIDFQQLTPEELQWLQTYNRNVYETLAPCLEPLEAQWLKQQTIG